VKALGVVYEDDPESTYILYRLLDNYLIKLNELLCLDKVDYEELNLI
jgi:hypothetical protein